MCSPSAVSDHGERSNGRRVGSGRSHSVLSCEVDSASDSYAALYIAENLNHSDDTAGSKCNTCTRKKFLTLAENYLQGIALRSGNSLRVNEVLLCLGKEI